MEANGFIISSINTVPVEPAYKTYLNQHVQIRKRQIKPQRPQTTTKISRGPLVASGTKCELI